MGNEYDWLIDTTCKAVGGLAKGYAITFRLLTIVVVVFVPLGIWKMVDIAIWCWNHLHIHFSVGTS